MNTDTETLTAAAPALAEALRLVLAALEDRDLSGSPGLYDAIPWDNMEYALALVDDTPNK